MKATGANTVTLTVTGMSCAACVQAVERAVAAVPGVLQASVNLAAGTVAAVCTHTTFEQEIIAAVRAAGFNAAPRETFSQRTARESKELSDQKRRVFIALLFGAALFYIAMLPMTNIRLLPLASLLHTLMHESPLVYAGLQAALLIPILAAGRRFFVLGFRAIAARRPNMDSLVSISAAAAVVYSVYAMFQIAATGGSEAWVHELYFETAGVILSLVMLGKTLEHTSRAKTSGAISALMNLAPKTAIIRKDGQETEVPLALVMPGSEVVVKPGAQIPVDGEVIEGASAVDEAMLTGEAWPVKKTAGSGVFTGTVNQNGRLVVRADSTGEQTVLAGIVRLVENAMAQKAPIAALGDKVCAVFVPVVCAIAVLSALVWLIAGGGAALALRVFITTLVIACPCALGLATPTAVMTAVGRAARRGILIKTGAALETLSETMTVVFDKTGTLTAGRPVVTDIVPLTEGLSEAGLLDIAAACERGSEHPIAAAITAKTAGVNLASCEKTACDFESFTGFGITAKINGEAYHIGNARFMERGGQAVAHSAADVFDRLSAEGKTAVYIANETQIIGILAVADPIREEAVDVISDLLANGQKVIMLTGDNEKTAQSVAVRLGIENWRAELLPGDKSAIITELKKDGHLAFAGDGINDAPALAAADTGLALGSAADVAINAADIIITSSNLRDLPRAIDISRLAMRRVKQNLFFAFAYNVLAIPIAAGVLYAFGGPLLNPMFAALAMSASSVSVVFNSLRK